MHIAHTPTPGARPGHTHRQLHAKALRALVFSPRLTPLISYHVPRCSEMLATRFPASHRALRFVLTRMKGSIVALTTGLVASVSAFHGAPVSAVSSRHATVQMGSSVKELRERVTSVKNTKKITSAMKLVAAAKVRRAQEAVIRSRPFSETLERILGGLLGRLSTEALDIPLMETREVHWL